MLIFVIGYFVSIGTFATLTTIHPPSELQAMFELPFGKVPMLASGVTKINNETIDYKLYINATFYNVPAGTVLIITAQNYLLLNGTWTSLEPITLPSFIPREGL